jgi:hypothetical protein
MRFIDSIEAIPTTYLELIGKYEAKVKKDNISDEQEKIEALKDVGKDHPNYLGNLPVLVTGMDILTESVFRRNQLLKGAKVTDINKEIEEQVRLLKRKNSAYDELGELNKNPRNISKAVWAIFQNRNAQLLKLSAPVGGINGYDIFDSVYMGPDEAFTDWLNRGAVSRLTNYMNAVLVEYGTTMRACYPEIIVQLADGEIIILKRKEGIRKLEKLIKHMYM